MGQLEGKVALITGGASGLGLADSELLAEEGAIVVMTDINENAGRTAAEKIGSQALFQKHDVAEEKDWLSVLAEVDRRYGRLDILVNNAGLVRHGDIETCTLDEFRLLYRIMVEGTFLGCKYAIPLMARSGGGSIINISSMSSHQGFPTIVGYVAAKGAVRSMTKSIAIYCQQNNYGIRCNSIHPGKINTGLISEESTPEAAVRRDATDEVLPAGAFGAPKDVARLVLYLASPASRFMTGSELLIDNGATITPLG